ncbi:hypothetical protein BH11BAC3_BH11BAC3_11440 [soil metagenome]
MIAYNKNWLKNIFIHEQADEAFLKACLNESEQQAIKTAYPVGFYTPNVFIRIGLALLTFIILLCIFGLFILMLSSSSDDFLGGLSVFFSLVTFGCLEFAVQGKNHFKSGVDDALLWTATGLLFGGISFLANAGHITNCILILLISSYASVRFIDKLMTAVACISLLGIFYFSFLKSGELFKAILPFILMIVSLAMYFLSAKLKNSVSLFLYKSNLQVVEIVALLSLYCAGNYFLVSELSNELSHENMPIALGWLFWFFTCIIPIIYLVSGIRKKDVVLIRSGLILIAAMVFTIKYYYHFASVEMTMLISGVLLLLISYALNRLLKKPVNGFTSDAEITSNTMSDLQIESLILAQTLSVDKVDTTPGFGGGSFGGGGSSGEF